MSTRSRNIALLILLSIVGATLWSQEAAGGKEALQARLAELKKAMAANQAALKNYQWIETTEVNVKGDTKKTEKKGCHYGPDGKVVKTPIGIQEPPKEPPRGLKGRIVEKKMAEMKDYMTRLKALIGHYVPPDSERMQASYQAGKASLTPNPDGLASLSFGDYYKPGDKLTLGFDSAAKKLRSYDVDSYLDDQKDVVTLTNQFASLPDGTNFLQQTVLTSKSKEIQITTTNSDYTKIGQ